MTTIVTWAAVDTHGVSAVYIASDSRITWGHSSTWDSGRKTFACHTQPLVVGYWGDVVFPAIALPEVIERLDHGMLNLDSNRPYGPFGSAIRRLWLDYPASQRRDCGLIMAHRLGRGVRSIFSLAVFTYEAATDTWTRRSIPMPSRSAELRIAGSGRSAVRTAKRLWDASDQGNTSRAVFSAFCEGLLSGTDAFSGGGPQLVRLRRIGNGQTLGVAVGSSRYFAGGAIPREEIAPNTEWFNELFERIDGVSLKRLDGAQRHAPR